MKSVYDLLTHLVNERERISDRCNLLKYDAMHGEPEVKAEYDGLVARYKQVEQQISNLEKQYFIGINDMGKIISKYTGKHYVPKIFRELYNKDGQNYYTYSFIACYINDQNPYYSNENYQICLMEDEYHKLLDGINGKAHTIQFSGSEMFEFEQLFPAGLVEHANFIKNCIYTFPNREISTDFKNRIKPLLIKHLQSLEVVSVDENIDLGL